MLYLESLQSDGLPIGLNNPAFVDTIRKEFRSIDWKPIREYDVASVIGYIGGNR